MKIHESGPGEPGILKAIMGVAVLAGIGGDQIPDAETERTIVSFINRYFGDLRVAELIYAYELALAGYIECDTRVYGVMGVRFFGNYLSAYKKWLATKIG